MARKKKDEGAMGSWMDTYGDMVTLLLTFFVALFSMSSISEEKWEKLVKAFTKRGDETSQVVITPVGEGNDLGANYGEDPLPADGDNIETDTRLPSDFNELYDYLKTYVEENNMESTVEVMKGDDSVYIRFQDSIFFNPDNYHLRPESEPILNFIGTALKNVEDQIMIINIDGHTAAIPQIPDYPVSDRRLSSERASSVAIYFEEESMLDPKKVISIGYGKNRPVGDNNTLEGQKMNRRVDMLIVSNDSETGGKQILAQMLTGTFDPSLYPKSGGLQETLLPELEEKDGVIIETNKAPEPPAEPSSSAPPDGAAQESNGAADSQAEPQGDPVQPPGQLAQPGQSAASSGGEASAGGEQAPAPEEAASNSAA